MFSFSEDSTSAPWSHLITDFSAHCLKSSLPLRFSLCEHEASPPTVQWLAVYIKLQVLTFRVVESSECYHNRNIYSFNSPRKVNNIITVGGYCKYLSMPEFIALWEFIILTEFPSAVIY